MKTVSHNSRGRKPKPPPPSSGSETRELPADEYVIQQYLIIRQTEQSEGVVVSVPDGRVKEVVFHKKLIILVSFIGG